MDVDGEGARCPRCGARQFNRRGLLQWGSGQIECLGCGQRLRPASAHAARKAKRAARRERRDERADRKSASSSKAAAKAERKADLLARYEALKEREAAKRAK